MGFLTGSDDREGDRGPGIVLRGWDRGRDGRGRSRCAGDVWGWGDRCALPVRRGEWRHGHASLRCASETEGGELENVDALAAHDDLVGEHPAPYGDVPAFRIGPVVGATVQILCLGRSDEFGGLTFHFGEESRGRGACGLLRTEGVLPGPAQPCTAFSASSRTALSSPNASRAVAPSSCSRRRLARAWRVARSGRR